MGYSGVEIIGIHRQCGGIDCAGRRPAKYGKGILLGQRQQFADRFEHANLIGGARAATGQDKAGL